MESKASISTVADYIRSLNNEKLAEFLLYNVKCRTCDANYCDYKFCLALIMELLERPHEE